MKTEKELSKESAVRRPVAIEDGFPVEFASLLAERESWRKEIYRPPYYIHKWWARRLGSVFRAILLSCAVGPNEDVREVFYRRPRFQNLTVWDPFMGSGVTIGEAVKLGFRTVGRDINPVSALMVQAALTDYSRQEVVETYEDLSRTAGKTITSLYKTEVQGHSADVLYYYWVKQVRCPNCGVPADLFKSRIFIKDARPSKCPDAKAVCPECGGIDDVRYDQVKATCYTCQTSYNPKAGTVARGKIRCAGCGESFAPLDAVRATNAPPGHRMYAKMVLGDQGEKIVLASGEDDDRRYAEVERKLQAIWDLIPKEKIAPGYNTNQVLNYNYRYWHQMFNARQLYALGTLGEAVSRIQHHEVRLLFACLFSGVLEFNNMFASFKGTGTGAVRHMFSHHVLKPELTPLEANVWGTPKSSGAFSTLFRSRILRALDYKDSPFELRLGTSRGRPISRKVYGAARHLAAKVVTNYEDFAGSDAVYVSCGDSSHTDLADGCVDVVVTDPPFFDNVYYSELADFFFVWLRRLVRDSPFVSGRSTRDPKEVQCADAETFRDRLTAVFRECHRVLKRQGLMVFTYHHSRLEGWCAVYESIASAGFEIVRCYPVKSEMAVAVPIKQSKAPISFDLIIVCAKRYRRLVEGGDGDFSLRACVEESRRSSAGLVRAGLRLLRGDRAIIFMGSVLSHLARKRDLQEELRLLASLQRVVADLTDDSPQVDQEGWQGRPLPHILQQLELMF